jgi:hypothetical protein
MPQPSSTTDSPPCIQCGAETPTARRRTFLGFREWTCSACGTVNTLPLSPAYRFGYWLICAIIVLGSVQFALEGRVPVPGALGIALVATIVIALKRDAQLRRQRAVDMPLPEASRVRSRASRTRMIIIAAALCVGTIVLFPPWRAQATRTTSTYNRIAGTNTVVDEFRWTIPFASVFDPPSDPRLLEGVLAESLARAKAGPPAAIDSALSAYMKELQRVETRARIPYHLTVLGLGDRPPSDDYVVRAASFAFEIDFPRLALTLASIGALASAALVSISRAP